MKRKRAAAKKLKKKKRKTEALLGRALQPGRESIRLHALLRGKIEISLKAPVSSYTDFAIWYTPGVAEPCKAIAKNKSLVYEYTNKWNTVAIVTDGTRVLGLGDLGPEAALPVMEGKALLYKYLGGVDAFPICVGSKDPDDIIRTVKLIQPSFGGINLEDIAQPKCFEILDTLRKESEIPIWHDDQQGTATVVLAAAMNAMKVVGKKNHQAQVALIGAGAANIRTAHLLMTAGFDAGKIMMVDSKGILHRSRTDLSEHFPQKWELAQITNGQGRTGHIAEALKGTDMVIAMSTPDPGTIKPEWIKDMATDPIVMACANPTPEIWPWSAKKAGAKIVATGRSDFPNQVNNSLGFPGIFRGALDVRAKTITDTMCIAAANELAAVAEEQGLNEEFIIPTMEQSEVFWREATAVALKAQEEGLAQRKASRAELLEEAKGMISRARAMVASEMKLGFIKSRAPEVPFALGA